MGGKKRRGKPTLEDELEALAAVSGDPSAPDARARLSAGLASPHGLVVAEAARLAKEHRVEGLDAELVVAFARLMDDPVKRDPGCHGKLAILEALDALEASEEETFFLGARYVQKEPAWGPPVDTATGVRARSVLALARNANADLPLLAAELLADPEPPVRQAAADALAARESRASAAPLALKLAIGDADPIVTLAVMSALLATAPDWALPRLKVHLDADDDTTELAALALGQSRREDALTLLLGALEACVRSDDRALYLRALGLHRSDRALDALLAVIAGANTADARAAVLALAPRRFDPGVRERVIEAARGARIDLSAELEKALGLE